MAGLLRSAVRRGFASGGVLGQSRAFNTRASVLLADTQFHYQDLYEPSAPKDVPWSPNHPSAPWGSHGF